ncbi:MAG: M23 family metallopeptidase [Sandaracinaceae bacterium]|nr:M23 family metallopeptidase [Sandaracinaceae bacterium]
MLTIQTPYGPLPLTDVFGLTPWRATLRETRFALLGDEDAPPTRWGLSSLRQLKPRIAVGLYLGRDPVPRRCTITNLYNYRQPPVTEGWSVRRTDVEDFRGRSLTYDSHNGTDFSIPPGSVVTAPAPGTVARVSSEFHRGGRKIFLDHGAGLVTSCNHLARPLVEVGQRVRRGEPIALSGYSGLDAVVAFPHSPPHVHFNVFLGGTYVDPFAREGQVSLWRHRNAPRPTPREDLEDGAIPPSGFDDGLVETLIAGLRKRPLREQLDAARTPRERAVGLLFFMGIYPWLFPQRPSVYTAAAARAPRLDLPFSAEQYDDVVFADELARG